jgi:hypothetical protein
VTAAQIAAALDGLTSPDVGRCLTGVEIEDVHHRQFRVASSGHRDARRRESPAPGLAQRARPAARASHRETRVPLVEVGSRQEAGRLSEVRAAARRWTGGATEEAAFCGGAERRRRASARPWTGGATEEAAFCGDAERRRRASTRSGARGPARSAVLAVENGSCGGSGASRRASAPRRGGSGVYVEASPPAARGAPASRARRVAGPGAPPGSSCLHTPPGRGTPPATRTPEGSGLARPRPP